MESPKRTLLLVEDEMLIAMAEAKALTEEGYSVILVRSGEEAIDAVDSDLGSSIDLILMDIDLGKGIDGMAAAREILKRRDIPLVFLSSHTQTEIIEQSERITDYGYIVKNRGDAVLLTSLKMAFKLRQAHRQMEERDERFRGLFENIKEGMCIMDRDDRFVFANPAARSMFGLQYGQLEGEPLSRFLDERHAGIVEERNRLLRRGEKCEYGLEIVQAGGASAKLRMKSEPQFDGKRQYMGSFVIIHDYLASRRSSIPE